MTGCVKDADKFKAACDIDVYKRQILAKTQHNAVAPAQHELAPIFSTTNIATDQNHLVMATMKKICLLYTSKYI